MNPIADAYNHSATGLNVFHPYRYDQVTDWIERQNPDTILNLGWNSEVEIFDYVNQEFMLNERPFASDEDL